jgi:hypothetical protein
MSSRVTQDDVDSVKDVPIEEALNYIETLERERRGLLKVGRAVQKARNAQEAAELQRTQIEQRATEAKVALDAIEVALAEQQPQPSDLGLERVWAKSRRMPTCDVAATLCVGPAPGLRAVDATTFRNPGATGALQRCGYEGRECSLTT